MLTSCMCGWPSWKPIQGIPTCFRNVYGRYINFICETAFFDPPLGIPTRIHLTPKLFVASPTRHYQNALLVAKHLSQAPGATVKMHCWLPHICRKPQAPLSKCIAGCQTFVASPRRHCQNALLAAKHLSPAPSPTIKMNCCCRVKVAVGGCGRGA